MLEPIGSPGLQSPTSFNATVRHLRAFLAVARNGSFTRAAIALHLSQPSLTMAVRQLEDIVGLSLFDRTTRTVRLTPEGSDFVPVAERLVADFDDAIQDIRQAATRRRGRLSVGVVHSVATKIVPDVLPRYLARNPLVRVQLRDGNSSDVRHGIRSREVDFGFCSKDAEDPELDFAPLFRDRMGLLMRRGHPLAASQRPLAWVEIGNYDFIGLTRDTATGSLLDAVPSLPASVRAPRCEVSMNDTLWVLLQAGVGVTTVPALAVFGRPGTDLVFRPLAEPEVWRTVYIATRRGRGLPTTGAEFIRLVRERVAMLSQSSPLIGGPD